MNICDDCGKSYPGKPYHTFDPGDCVDEAPNGAVSYHQSCTGNMCANCAGPFLAPDDLLDPRIPPVDFYDPRIHATLEGQAAQGYI